MILSNFQIAHATNYLEKFPTETYDLGLPWNDPTNAFSNDGNYATTSGTALFSVQYYKGFNFNFNSSCTIEKVFIKIRFKWHLYYNFSSSSAYTVQLAQWFNITSTTWFLYYPIDTRLISDWVMGDTGEMYRYILFDNPLYLENDIYDATSYITTYNLLNNMQIRIDSFINPFATVIYVDSVSVAVIYSLSSTDNGLVVGIAVGVGAGLAIGVSLMVIYQVKLRREVS
jgi:hypothetical protein